MPAAIVDRQRGHRHLYQCGCPMVQHSRPASVCKWPLSPGNTSWGTQLSQRPSTYQEVSTNTIEKKAGFSIRHCYTYPLCPMLGKGASRSKLTKEAPHAKAP